MITFLSVPCAFKAIELWKITLIDKTTAMHTGLEQHEWVNTELFLYHLSQKCQCVIDVLRAVGMCQLDFSFHGTTHCVPYVGSAEILFGFLWGWNSNVCARTFLYWSLCCMCLYWSLVCKLAPAKMQFLSTKAVWQKLISCLSQMCDCRFPCWFSWLFVL